jgi:hypothetical protein
MNYVLEILLDFELSLVLSELHLKSSHKKWQCASTSWVAVNVCISIPTAHTKWSAR